MLCQCILYKCITIFLQGSIGKQTVNVSWAGPTIDDDGESSDDDNNASENGDINFIDSAAEQVSVNDKPVSDHAELVNFDGDDDNDDQEPDREENFSIDIDPVDSTLAIMPVTEPVLSEASQVIWNGFKIVGDNIDKNIRPSYQRCHCQTASLYYFHACAIGDRIDFSCLPNIQPTSVSIDPTDLLPKTADVDALKDEFQILVSRYYTSSYVFFFVLCTVFSVYCLQNFSAGYKQLEFT